jgi:methylenetetrahydrofolate dehydrogenase (NADP+)/methenyltetrahydrofolate cyclohydrolase
MDGKALAARIRAEVTDEVAAFARPIGLATVLVGDDPASEVYIRLKHKASLEVGIEARDLRRRARRSCSGSSPSSTQTIMSTGSSSNCRCPKDWTSAG